MKIKSTTLKTHITPENNREFPLNINIKSSKETKKIEVSTLKGHVETSKQLEKENIELSIKFRMETFPIYMDIDKRNSINDYPVPLKSENLIEILENKYNIEIQNYTEIKRILEFTNYQKIQPFARIYQNQKIEKVLNAYQLDKFIREELIRLIAPIEIYSKNKLSNIILEKSSKLTKHKKYLAFYYQNYNKYLYKAPQISIKKDGVTKYKNWMDKSVKAINDYSQSDSYIQKTLIKYNGNIPIWILLDKITFGTFSFFLTILNSNVSLDFGNEIFGSNESKPDPKAIFSFMEAVVILRNTVSHCQNVITKDYKAIPLNLFPDIDKENKKNNSLYTYLLIIKYLYSELGEENKIKWNDFINKIFEKINNDKIIEKAIGIPKTKDKNLLLEINNN